MDDNTAIVRRNRENSLKSTGPKTDAGKAIASRNRMDHGLRANPAAVRGEDGRAFRAMHKRLVSQVSPTNEIEVGLVNRIATCLWRLERATAVDGAISRLAVRSVAPLMEEAQDWVERVNAAWNVHFVEVLDPALLRQGRAHGLVGPEQNWFRGVRYGIRDLDRLRKEMKGCGAGVTAMITMLNDLVNRLVKWQNVFGRDHVEQLAWLLGAEADSFGGVELGQALPNERGRGSPILSLVYEAQRREAGSELPGQLSSLIQRRQDTLRQQRDLCAQKYTAQEERLRETAALLPAEETLDRLIRYETHTDRALHRAIDSLAKLRGATYESLSSRMVGCTADGTVVALEQQRTRSIGGGLAGKKLPNEAREARARPQARQIVAEVG